jgi:hypothetical protein
MSSRPLSPSLSFYLNKPAMALVLFKCTPPAPCCSFPNSFISIEDVVEMKMKMMF